MAFAYSDSESKQWAQKGRRGGEEGGQGGRRGSVSSPSSFRLLSSKTVVMIPPRNWQAHLELFNLIPQCCQMKARIKQVAAARPPHAHAHARTHTTVDHLSGNDWKDSSILESLIKKTAGEMENPVLIRPITQKVAKGWGRKKEK